MRGRFLPSAAGAPTLLREADRSSHGHRIDFIFTVNANDMRAHRVRGANAVAAQDRQDHAVMFGMRFRKPPEIAELGAAKWLHPRARRQRDFRDMAVLRAGIDRAVKTLIELMKAFGIAGMAQHAQLPVDRLKPMPLGR